MQEIVRPQSGFTLIEAVIYIALLAIMIGGGIVGVYNILEGSGRTREAMYREQDAYFITRKIDSVLSDAKSVQNADGNRLEVTTSEDDFLIIELDTTAEQIVLRRGGTKDALHDPFIKAEDLQFVSSSTQNTITATFMLNEHTYSSSYFLP